MRHVTFEFNTGTTNRRAILIRELYIDGSCANSQRLRRDLVLQSYVGWFRSFLTSDCERKEQKKQ